MRPQAISTVALGLQQRQAPTHRKRRNPKFLSNASVLLRSGSLRSISRASTSPPSGHGPLDSKAFGFVDISIGVRAEAGTPREPSRRSSATPPLVATTLHNPVHLDVVLA